jgi:tetratricopeptide (TPR) repeat protein
MQIQEAIWTQYYELGNSALTAKQWDVAEKMFAAAAEEARRMFINPRLLADSWFGLAQTHHSRNQFELATFFYKKAITFYLEEPRYRLKLAACWDNLAELHLLNSELSKALPLYKKSIALYEKALGVDNPVLAPRLIRLGYIYAKLKSCDKALDCYQRAKSLTDTTDKSMKRNGAPSKVPCVDENYQSHGNLQVSSSKTDDKNNYSSRPLHSVAVRRRALANIVSVEAPAVGAPL